MVGVPVAEIFMPVVAQDIIDREIATVPLAVAIALWLIRYSHER